MFNNKIANLILAFVISIGLWCYVVYAVNPVQKQTFRDIPVQLVNEEILNENGLAVANDTNITVNVAVEGSRKVLAAMDTDSFTATADVSQCIAGTNSVAVEIKMTKNASLASDSTLTVQIEVEKLVTESKDIKIKYSGEAGSGREVEAELTGDSTVRVSGAESLVAKVAYVAADISVAEVKTTDQLMEAELKPVDSSGSAVKNVSVSKETAELRVSIYNTKKVSLVVKTTGQLPSGYSLEGVKSQETIVIRGSEAALENITSVSAEYIDISGFTKTTEVKLSLVLPDGVELSSGEKTPVAQIYIEGDSSYDVTIGSDAINIRNLDDESYEARIISGSISVSVTGDSGVTENDFTLSINVKGLDEGEHEVPLTVRYKGSGTVTSAPDTVTVRISEKE